MSKSKFINIVIIAVMLLLGCGAEKVKAPFFDSLYLTYKDFPTSGKFLNHYEFHLLSNGNFDILLYAKTESGERGHDSTHFSVNSWGEFMDKDIIPLWLPVRYRKEGVQWKDFSVVRRTHWKKWDVWIVKDKAKVTTFYYEVTTGFWVGYEVSTQIGVGELVLVDTNANIPTAE